MQYELKETPKGPTRLFDAADVDAAAEYWLDRCPGMPLRVVGGSEGYGFGMHSEVRPLLDAVARLKAERALAASSDDGYRFLVQNAVAAGTLADQEQVDAVMQFAEHHAGGLVVLGRSLDDGRYVKMHDSWGDDGKVVVHAYDPEDEMINADVEYYFDTGAEALERFLAFGTEPRVYCVGLPVTILVDDAGVVRYEVDLCEASSAVREDTAVPIDEEGQPLYTDEQVDSDAKRVEAALIEGTIAPKAV